MSEANKATGVVEANKTPSPWLNMRISFLSVTPEFWEAYNYVFELYTSLRGCFLKNGEARMVTSTGLNSTLLVRLHCLTKASWFEKSQSYIRRRHPKCFIQLTILAYRPRTPPHEHDYKRWRARLTDREYAAIETELLTRIGTSEVVTSSWVPVNRHDFPRHP